MKCCSKYADARTIKPDLVQRSVRFQHRVQTYCSACFAIASFQKQLNSIILAVSMAMIAPLEPIDSIQASTSTTCYTAANRTDEQRSNHIKLLTTPHTRCCQKSLRKRLMDLWVSLSQRQKLQHKHEQMHLRGSTHCRSSGMSIHLKSIAMPSLNQKHRKHVPHGICSSARA